MHPGQHVKVDIDDWDLAGKIGELVEEEPVAGSTQSLVMVEGIVHTVPRSTLRPTEEPVSKSVHH